MDLPEQFQYAHFGGTLAQTLQLRVSGRTSEIVNVYPYGLMMVSQTESPKCYKEKDKNHDHDKC